MKIRLLLAGAAAVAAVATPFAAHAVGTTTGCTTATSPGPQQGGVAVPNPDGTAWVNPTGYSGASGSHGYIQAGSGGVNGYSTDKGNLNGSASTGGVCIAFNGTGVTS